MKFSSTHFLSDFISKIFLAALLAVSHFTSIDALAQSCPSPSMNFVFINQVTDSTAFLNWTNVSAADSFLVEYGPAAFPVGVGVTEYTTLSGITLDSLNPCVDYQFFLYSVCGDEMSDPIGPFFFTTLCEQTCTYTFNLFDIFGDGWNGSFLTIAYKGEDIIYTIDFTQGGQATYELEVINSVPVCISYTPGIFENEVSFDILDPDGNSIYSDGPDPITGDIFDFVGCDASCIAPKNWNMSDVNATNATTAWSLLPGVDGALFLEYGPLGFIRGTGTQTTVAAGSSSFKMTGLEEKTWYNVYLGVDCGLDSSEVIGPLTFETLWLNDVGVTTISPNPDDFCNLGSGDTITVGLTNFGQTPQTLFNFFYSINGIPASIPIPMDGLFTGVVGNDSTQFLQFETTYDFTPGYYVIEAWTEFEEDSDLTNDTFRIEFLNSFPKPVDEGAERDWTAGHIDIVKVKPVITCSPFT